MNDEVNWGCADEQEASIIIISLFAGMDTAITMVLVEMIFSRQIGAG